MRLVLLTLNFMAISMVGYAQQSTNIGKTPNQAKTQSQGITPASAKAPTPTPTPTPAETPIETPASTETLGASTQTEPVVNPDPEFDPTKPILILINESTPDQVMVFTNTGKWLDTVKTINISLDVGTGAITATLTSWKGVMKPKTPKVLKAKVKELKSVTTEVFNDKLEESNK